ncbi:Flp family type IVb pilin [Marinococcus luteus]|uniref:Flp family type IVb pilin n=1 Tax=Marinococcus luteus TaxID=1122204 RepID=UPI002ACD1C50|nr:Flp family type IVb pilin [Marinococcus luteus]MDZ5783473.1 Flp family type IVb pilin [Marinococcus luteus]
MVEIFKNLVVEEEGQGMTEYGLILGLIAVAVIAAIVTLGDEINTILGDVTDGLTNPEDAETPE